MRLEYINNSFDHDEIGEEIGNTFGEPYFILFKGDNIIYSDTVGHYKSFATEFNWAKHICRYLNTPIQDIQLKFIKHLSPERIAAIKKEFC